MKVAYVIFYNHPQHPKQYTIRKHYGVKLKTFTSKLPADNGAELGHWNTLLQARAALPPGLKRLSVHALDAEPSGPTVPIEGWI